MVLRLDPDHPMVWRTPTTVQFGIEHPVAVLDSASPTFGGLETPRELVLDLLARGVPEGLLTALAAEHGLPRAGLEELLTELSAVLLEVDRPNGPLAGVVIAVDGTGAAAEEIALLLGALGARVCAAPEAATGGGARSAELAVVVSHYLTDPRRAAVWLRDDVPHLLVEFGERSIRVGPVVAPDVGREPSDRGPCAGCIEHARTDADTAWPAIALQALRRLAPSADASGVAAAAAMVARVLTEFAAGTGSWHDHAVRLLRPGWAGRAMTVERVRPHPNCGCRSLPEIGTAPAPPSVVIRPPPTRGPDAPGRG